MSRKRNTFSKAIGHLKSTKIDEKFGVLNEIPTNNTLGVTVPDAGTNTIQQFDGNFPDQATVNFEINGSDGKDTSGLFDSEGNSKLIGPPGDNSYILGPMSAMYYTWAYPTVWTMFGYIREADRRMVNLGWVYSTLDEWDQKEESFGSYGQLTYEQALWFANTKKKDGAGNTPNDSNYYAFYPGPPSNTPDQYGRYACIITGTAKTNKDYYTQYAPLGDQAADNFSAMMGKGSSKISGTENQNKAKKGDPSTDSNDFNPYVNFPWDNNTIKLGSRLLRSITDVTRYGGDKIVKGLPSDVTQYIKHWDGGGGKIVDYMFGGSKNAQNILGKNWYNTDYFAPSITSGRGGLLKGGEIDVARQYMSKGARRGTPWGPKSGNYWVGDAPKTGKVGIKNPWGSKISRGWSGTPEVKVKAGTIDAIKMGGDDVAKLATKGARTSKVLSRLVPGVAIAAATYDVTTRIQSGDYAGAVLGAVSAIPGPVGWLGFGGQLAYDAARAGWFTNNKVRGRSGAKRAMGEELIFEEVKLASNEKAILDKFAEIGADDYIRQMTAIMAQMGITPELSQIIIKSFYGAELGDNEKKIIEIALPKVLNYMDPVSELSPDNPLSTEEDPWALTKQTKALNQESLELSEGRTRIMKSLKEPVVLPETKQKSYKVNPGKRKKTNFQGMDKLVGDIKPQTPFKTKRDVWSKDWQDYNARQSQNKKNEVLEKVGDGKFAFNYMLNDSRKMNAEQLEKFWGLHPEMYSYFYNGKKYKALRKEQVKGDYVVFMEDENGVKSNMLQSELNLKLSEEHEKQLLAEYNEIQSEKDPTPFLKDPLMKKVAKRLKNEIDYEGKPAVKGYPNEPPPEMVNGFHPKYGKSYKYDKLDPVSAVMMSRAPTGDPEIDANVKKAAKKAKPKVNEEYSDWRKDVLY